jgi:hypothetical protein
MFQYKSNNTNFTQYNQVLVVLFIRSKFALECACALFLETEVVDNKTHKLDIGKAQLNQDTQKNSQPLPHA